MRSPHLTAKLASSCALWLGVDHNTAAVRRLSLPTVPGHSRAPPQQQDLLVALCDFRSAAVDALTTRAERTRCIYQTVQQQPKRSSCSGHFGRLWVLWVIVVGN